MQSDDQLQHTSLRKGHNSSIELLYFPVFYLTVHFSFLFTYCIWWSLASSWGSVAFLSLFDGNTPCHHHIIPAFSFASRYSYTWFASTGIVHQLWHNTIPHFIAIMFLQIVCSVMPKCRMLKGQVWAHKEWTCMYTHQFEVLAHCNKHAWIYTKYLVPLSGCSVIWSVFNDQGNRGWIALFSNLYMICAYLQRLCKLYNCQCKCM